MPDEPERKQPENDNDVQPDTQADFGAVLTETRSDDKDRQQSSVTNDSTKTGSGSSGAGTGTEQNSIHSSDKSAEKTESGDNKAARFGNPLSLFQSFSDTVAKSAKDTFKAAEAYLPQMEIFSGGAKPPQEKAQSKDEASIKTADAGNEKISAQLDNYFNFRDGGKSATAKDGASRQEPGSYKNEDGSSYEIDKNGDMTKLTTAPSEKHPEGQTFKASYNENHELVKMETPGGKTFTRTSPENEKGFAYWQSRDAAGNKTSFGNASNNAFVGKLDLNSDGAKFMIGHDKRNPSQNTKWAGSMIEYGSDGSETRSTLHAEKGKTTGFDSTVKEADGTQIKSSSKIDEPGKTSLTGSTEITSADGDSKTIIKDGKVTERKENLLASEKLAEVARNLDGNDRLQNLKHASLTKHGDSTHVSIDNYGERNQRSIQPGTVINGTRPSHTHVSKHLEFDLKTGKDGSISMSNIDGMRGYGSALGPLGRRWHSGSSEVHDIRMTKGRDGHTSLDTRSDRGWLHASHNQLTPEAQAGMDSMTGKGSKMIDFLNENSKQATIDHAEKRGFSFSMQPTEKFKEMAKESGMPMEIGDKLSAKFSYSENGMKLTDIQGVKALGQNVTGVQIEPGKGGEMSMKAEYTNPKTGEKGSIPIPMSQAKAILAMMGQENLARKK